MSGIGAGGGGGGMDLIVTEGDRQEEIRLEPLEDGSFEVILGDGAKRYEVDVAAAGGGPLLSLRLRDTGQQYEVAVQRISRGDECVYRVSSSRGVDTVSVTDPLTHLMQQANPEKGSGGQVASAMMPGRVVEVLVSEGAEVEQGQGIVVVEAMKMKNEIHAEAAGTVAKIHVEAGQNVEGGDPLFEIS
ncbi:MAG: biotin/lipoyl-containing protein [Acidobacteriota bacterium]